MVEPNGSYSTLYPIRAKMSRFLANQVRTKTRVTFFPRSPSVVLNCDWFVDCRSCHVFVAFTGLC